MELPDNAYMLNGYCSNTVTQELWATPGLELWSYGFIDPHRVGVYNDWPDMLAEICRRTGQSKAAWTRPDWI